MEAEWGERARVLRLNVQDPDARPLLTELGFRLTPTFILFDGEGREVWRTVGVIDAAVAREQLDALE